MQKYKCSDCQGVFCGWAIIVYKYKNKCPVCGGELREISNNKESRKVEGYHKKAVFLNKRNY
ncbi:hypothetical protein ES695_03535 [Candidatus Atribacteria bacterium 1244-E10-H5-B2]|nr:MAG: hypothetical protein ES695_03535 [Candidatus Atribacteria bacterium 1244-E10-H5-B2]